MDDVESKEININMCDLCGEKEATLKISKATEIFNFCSDCWGAYIARGNDKNKNYLKDKYNMLPESEKKEKIDKYIIKPLDTEMGLGGVIILILVIAIIWGIFSSDNSSSSYNSSSYGSSYSSSSSKSGQSFSEYLKEQDEDLYYSSKGRYYDSLGF